MLKYRNKIISNMINVLIFIIVIIIFFAFYNFVQLKILNKDYTNFFGYSIFEVATGSMSGVIEVDDIIVVKLTDNVKVNDIVTYKKENDFITHRVISINDGQLITKGDNNNTEDAPIVKDHLVGKVVFTLHGVGIWKKVLLTPSVTISIFATLVLFGIAFSTYDKDKAKVGLNTKKTSKKITKNKQAKEKEVPRNLADKQIVANEELEFLDTEDHYLIIDDEVIDVNEKDETKVVPDSNQSSLTEEIEIID